MMYEDSAVRPTANLELFWADLLNHLSILSCYYIIIVQGKGTETIILTHMKYFTISSLQHYNISPFKTHNNVCDIVSLPISLTSGKNRHYYFHFHPAEIKSIILRSFASFEHNIYPPPLWKFLDILQQSFMLPILKYLARSKIFSPLKHN